MKIKYYLLTIFLLLGLKNIAQENPKRLTFILLIDNEVVDASIIQNSYFKIVSKRVNDSISVIPFDYTVGSIYLQDSNYRKLFSVSEPSRIFIHFTYTKSVSPYLETIEYKKEIPVQWINDMYIIFSVYNYYNKESRKKYVLDKDGYGIEISIPAAGNVIPRWKM